MIVFDAGGASFVSTFFIGFCAGIGAVVAVSAGLGVIMLLKAGDADERDDPESAPPARL